MGAGVLVACGLDVVGGRVTAGDAAVEEAGAALPPEGTDGGRSEADAEADVLCPTGTTRVPVGNYCVDQTEVTNAQFDAFLAATADGGDAGFLDGGGPTSCAPFVFGRKDVVAGGPAAPVTSVDWCDAFAFCAWAGKRLCTDDEWTTSCTAGGTQPLPYGDAAVDGACNVSGAAADTKSYQACQGGYPGVFDMVGNVWEWTSGCNATNCNARGGAYDQPAATCTSVDSANIRTAGGAYGFRCCAPGE